jgi:dienelactone hydrolase
MMNDFARSPGVCDEARAYMQVLYGDMPPAPQVVRTTLVHTLSTPTHRLEIWQVDLTEPLAMAWHLTLHQPLPSVDGGTAVLLSPDGCWPHVVNAAAMAAVLAQGVCLAHFDRLLFAHDRPDAQSGGALHARWPERQFSAIAAWAWGLLANAQALRQIQNDKALDFKVFNSNTPHFNALKLGIMGHSRGGKAALLAGALDPGVALTVAHNSGCAGAASYQFNDGHSETLTALQAQFPHWLSSACDQASVRAQIQALDNRALLESLTGRHLCVMQADDDLWANPQGTRHAVARLQSHWDALGLGAQLHHFSRDGGHAMTALDWSRAAQTLAQI